MTETTKTALFLILALASGGLATWNYSQNKPPSASGFELVGQPFFDKFETAQAAAGLEITALNDKAERQTFSLKKVGGIWKIPSHFDYPAEAAERLANVSTALIGLTREALVGRLPSEHEQFGVLDPAEGNLNDPEATGKRLTLKGANGEVLADLIVGKNVVDDRPQDQVTRAFQQRDSRNQFYVRRADEQQTYKVTLNLNLSTKFSDWINTQLVEVSPADVSSIRIDNYQLKSNPDDPLGASRLKEIGEQVELTRADQFGPWTLTGLNAEQEQMNLPAVNGLNELLTNLKIVGVREKFKYQGQALINPDLSLVQNPDWLQDRDLYGQLVNTMAMDMSKRGFYLQADRAQRDRLQLISDFGQVSFTTREGIVYTLDFGKVIAGDESAIEIGASDESLANDDPETANSATTPETASKEDSPQTTENPLATSGDKNRFVLIRVASDRNSIGDGPPQAPTEPTAPTPPEGYTPASTNPPSEQSTEAEGTDTPTPERDPRFIQYDLDLANYEQAKTQFEVDKSRYERQLQEFETLVAETNKKVAELNERFGAWYYVVAANNLDNLKIRRQDLVQPKPTPPPTAPNPQPAESGDGVTPPTNETIPPGGGQPEPTGPEGKTNDDVNKEAGTSGAEKKSDPETPPGISEVAPPTESTPPPVQEPPPATGDQPPTPPPNPKKDG